MIGLDQIEDQINKVITSQQNLHEDPCKDLPRNSLPRSKFALPEDSPEELPDRVSDEDSSHDEASDEIYNEESNSRSNYLLNSR